MILYIKYIIILKLCLTKRVINLPFLNRLRAFIEPLLNRKNNLGFFHKEKKNNNHSLLKKNKKMKIGLIH